MMKLETLGFCFGKIDSLTWELKLEKIKEKIYKLFAEYSTKGLTTSSMFTWLATLYEPTTDLSKFLILLCLGISAHKNKVINLNII